MSALLLAQLRDTLVRLKAQSNSTFSTFDKQSLQQMLTSTIETLRTLYPDHLDHAQRFHLLQNLMLLEQQSVIIGPAAEAILLADLPTWQALREALIASIEATLTPNEAHSPD